MLFALFFWYYNYAWLHGWLHFIIYKKQLFLLRTDMQPTGIDFELEWIGYSWRSSLKIDRTVASTLNLCVFFINTLWILLYVFHWPSICLCSWPAWVDQAPGGGKDSKPAEDSQSGCGGEDSTWDPEPQTLPPPAYNQTVSNIHDLFVKNVYPWSGMHDVSANKSSYFHYRSIV